MRYILIVCLFLFACACQPVPRDAEGVKLTPTSKPPKISYERQYIGHNYERMIDLEACIVCYYRNGGIHCFTLKETALERRCTGGQNE